jgi:hypothetical protein
MVPRAGNRHRLCEFGIAALVAESPSDPADAKGEYGVEFVPLGHFTKLHELILAVPRRILAEGGCDKLFAALAPARCLSMSSRR